MRAMRERWNRLDPEKKKEMIGRFQALRAASQKKEIARSSDEKSADKKGAEADEKRPSASRREGLSGGRAREGRADRRITRHRPEARGRDVSKVGHRDHRHGHDARRHRDGDRHVSKAGHRGGGHRRHWGDRAGHRQERHGARSWDGRGGHPGPGYGRRADRPYSPRKASQRPDRGSRRPSAAGKASEGLEVKLGRLQKELDDLRRQIETK